MLTLAEKRGVAWLNDVTVLFEPSAAADAWECKGSEIYKMWALLLVILPGKRG